MKIADYFGLMLFVGLIGFLLGFRFYAYGLRIILRRDGYVNLSGDKYRIVGHVEKRADIEHWERMDPK